MRAGIVSAVLLVGTSGAFAASADDLTIGPGAYVYWASYHDGTSDRFREHIVAQGDGFEIYRSNDAYSDGTPADYYALFAGIYYAACDATMPTDEERAALLGLWPLEPGKSVEVASGDGASFTIGEATEYFLMGKNRPAHKVTGIYQADNDDGEETVIILDDLAFTAAIEWGDGGKDRAMLITSARPDATATIDPGLIGNCASLLNE